MLGRVDGFLLGPISSIIDTEQWATTLPLEDLGTPAVWILPSCTAPCRVATKTHSMAYCHVLRANIF